MLYNCSLTSMYINVVIVHKGIVIIVTYTLYINVVIVHKEIVITYQGCVWVACMLCWNTLH